METNQPEVQLYFLGSSKFTRGGQVVEVNSAKAVALLAYLAATSMPQSRERLLDLLWPDSAPEAGRKNLRNTLWAIRKTLGEEILPADDDRLALHPAAWTDLFIFSQLITISNPAFSHTLTGANLQFPTSNLHAHQTGSPISNLPSLIPLRAHVSNLHSSLNLYRGPFLDGLALADAPDFEIWLTAERERLGQLYLRTLSTLIDHHRAEADWPQVIQLAHRALVHDNLHEPIYRSLMEAHARLGERAEALRQYENLRAILAAELGVDPLPETEAMRAAILSGQLQPVKKTAAPALLPALKDLTGAGPKVTARPFVGRQAELDALTAELRLAAHGPARLVLISGEMGLGKSRLWQEWSARVSGHSGERHFEGASGLTILQTRCLEATRTLPFVPLTELLRHSTPLPRLLTSNTTLSPVWLAELTRLLPEIRLAWPDLPAPAGLPYEEEQRHLFEALVQLLLALRASPLLLFIDDAHWADQTTLAWLGYLAHRCRDQAILLVLSYRPEEAPPALVRLLAGWGREGLGRRLALSHLTRSESTALIASLGGDSARSEQLHTQSAGNPYFLLELCQAGPGDVPPALAELICARLDRLPQTTRQVLQSAAVLEPDFEATMLRRTSGRSEEEIIEALDELRQAAVLVEQGTHYTFAHPLVAAVVRQNLGGARRTFLHRRAAEALEAVHTHHLPPIAGRLAAHYTQAGESVRAAHYAEMAAAYALSLAAPAEAVDFYRQAMALESNPARQMGLGQAWHWQGDLPAARQAFEAALAGFIAQANNAGAAMACLQLAETYLPAGRPDETVHWTEKALIYLDHPLDSSAAHTHSGQPDPAAHAMAHMLLGAGLLQMGLRLAEAEHHLITAAQLAAADALAEVAAQSRFELGNLLARRNNLAGAVAAFEEAIRLAQAANNQYLLVLGYNNAAYHSLLAGNLAAAHTHIDTALALNESLLLSIPWQYLYSTRGEIALAEQQWDEAEKWFKRGRPEAEKHHNQELMATYQANLSLVARGRGDLDNALRLLETARKMAASLVAPTLQIQLDLWLTELYLERGEQVRAEATLSQVEARLAGAEQARLQARAKKLRQDSRLT